MGSSRDFVINRYSMCIFLLIKLLIQLFMGRGLLKGFGSSRIHVEVGQVEGFFAEIIRFGAL